MAIYFTTNRKIIDPETPAPKFTDLFPDQGPGTFRVGSATVEGDPDSETSVVKPEVFHEKFDEKEEERILGSTQMFGEIQAAMKNNFQDVFVFIHGYNTDFDWAIRVAASIAKKYKTGENDPIVTAFSWPGMGGGPVGFSSDGFGQVKWKYCADRDNAIYSGSAMARALMTLLDYLKTLAQKK